MLWFYPNIIHDKGAPLDNCFRFVDGTRVAIRGMKESCNVPKKRIHVFEFRNGYYKVLMVYMKSESTMLKCCVNPASWQQFNPSWLNGYSLSIYGDRVYPLSIYLQKLFSNPNGADQKDFSKAMNSWWHWKLFKFCRF